MIPVAITIESYLAEYFTSKYGGGMSEPIKISDKSDLYHVVWQVMERRPADVAPLLHGNLVILLPERRCGKDPLWYNHIGQRGLQLIERRIRMEFNNDFHEYLERNEYQGRPMEIGEAICVFMGLYRLESITEDALKKNYYRWRQAVRPHEKRGYNRRNERKMSENDKNFSDQV